MLIGPNTSDRPSGEDNSTDDGGKRVLAPDEATAIPRGRKGRTHGFGATKGQCDLGAGADRWD